MEPAGVAEPAGEAGPAGAPGAPASKNDKERSKRRSRRRWRKIKAKGEHAGARPQPGRNLGHPAGNWGLSGLTHRLEK